MLPIELSCTLSIPFSHILLLRIWCSTGAIYASSCPSVAFTGGVTATDNFGANSECGVAHMRHTLGAAPFFSFEACGTLSRVVSCLVRLPGLLHYFRNIYPVSCIIQVCSMPWRTSASPTIVSWYLYAVDGVSNQTYLDIL